MRGLGIAAWSVFIADAALVLLVVAFGLLAGDAVERDTMFGLAALAGVPLAAIFAVLGFCTLYGNRVGLWICLALAALPLILMAILVVQQNFL